MGNCCYLFVHLTFKLYFTVLWFNPLTMNSDIYVPVKIFWKCCLQYQGSYWIRVFYRDVFQYLFFHLKKNFQRKWEVFRPILSRDFLWKNPGVEEVSGLENSWRRMMLDNLLREKKAIFVDETFYEFLIRFLFTTKMCIFENHRILWIFKVNISTRKIGIPNSKSMHLRAFLKVISHKESFSWIALWLNRKKNHYFLPPIKSW